MRAPSLQNRLLPRRGSTRRISHFRILHGRLNNELYIGKLVWNRQRFIKDLDTGKRVSRLNPESEAETSSSACSVGSRIPQNHHPL